jgi:DNA-binding Lrp family transcriptional regulator
VERIAKLVSAKKYLILPSVKMFKLDVRFDTARAKGSSGKTLYKGDHKAVELSPANTLLVNALNQGLPLTKDPFGRLAEKLNLKEEELLHEIEDLKTNGVLQKFRFVLNHNKVGLSANAMVVWDVDENKTDEAGRIFADKEFISHCYARKRYDEFPYNMYTMIHADTTETLKRYIELLQKEISPLAFCALKTTRELMKRKASLLREDYTKWDQANILTAQQKSCSSRT